MEFTRNGITIVFYQKENDNKFSFYIKNNEELTQLLLDNVKTKRVKKENIRYAVKGIFEKLNNNSLKIKEEMSTEIQNPIIELGEKCQKIFGANMETKVIKKVGPDHAPVITVQIKIPDGRVYQASGINQKEAKKQAALEALAEL